MIARYYEASYSGIIYFVVNSYALVVIAGSLSLESGTSYFLASGRAGPVELGSFSLLWAITVTAAIAVALWLFSILWLQSCIRAAAYSLIFSPHYFMQKDRF